MNGKALATWTLALLLGCGNAWTQEAGDTGEDSFLPAQASDEARSAVDANVPADVTMRLMEADEAELPDAVTSEIELPEAAGEDTEAVRKAEFGLGVASSARQGGVDGRQVAADARARGAEMADRAMEKADIPGRAENAPNRPDDLPGPPERPEGTPEP